jgi:hypothetical protein
MGQAKVKRERVAKYTAAMTPEQRRIFTKLVALPDIPTGETIREQFHCSRATAEAVATALADFRLTPAQRKAKQAEPVAVALAPRRYFKPITRGGGVHAAFSDEAQEQLKRDFPRGGGVWSDEQGKWIHHAER